MKSAQQHSTAILVFANSSSAELAYKPIAKGEVLFDELTRHTLKTVLDTGLPYYHFSEQEQIGDSFAERFVNALQIVFDKGFKNIITLGNDTPHLRTASILKAHQQLKDGKFVLGPSADGGFYLMGLNKSQFCPEKFKELPWQTSLLAKTITSIAIRQGIEVFSLKTLFDIDSAQDLRMFVNRFQNIGKRLLSLIALLLNLKTEVFHRENLFPHFSFQNIPYNKGSPFYTRY